jgi:hypothetical protein
VIKEAERLAEARRAQSGHLMAAHTPHPDQEEIYRQTAAKEVSDRVTSPGYQGDTTFMGVSEPITTTDDGRRYDDDGNIIESTTLGGAVLTANAVTDESHPDAIRAAKEAEAPRRRGRPRKSEQQAEQQAEGLVDPVGDGPPSE